MQKKDNMIITENGIEKAVISRTVEEKYDKQQVKAKIEDRQQVKEQ